MRIQNVLGIVVALVILPAPVVRAEGPQPGQPGYVDPSGQPQVIGDPNAQYAQPQPQPTPESAGNAESQQGRGVEYGAYLMVPIFLSTPRENLDSIDPGLGLVGRIGWEFGGGFTAELMVGGHANGGVLGSDPVTFANFFAGAGVRYSFLNASALVPFVGVGLQLNFWGSDRALDGTFITMNNDYLALGLSGVAGVAYELSADLAVEAGVRADFSTVGKNSFGEGILEGGQLLLSPFLGATLYY